MANLTGSETGNHMEQNSPGKQRDYCFAIFSAVVKPFVSF